MSPRKPGAKGDGATHGIDLKKALKLARKAGLAVSYRGGTGEVNVTNSEGQVLALNIRNKSSPRVLTHMIRRELRKNK